MCVVENSGRFGGTYAAPICGLMIEKYLKDSIRGDARKARVEQLANLNLIPPRIYAELRKRDSLEQVKEGELKAAKDTLGIEDEPETKTETKKQRPSDNDSNKITPKIKADALLPNEKKKASKDSVNIQL
jgi:penicillin-binding protein 2